MEKYSFDILYLLFNLYVVSDSVGDLITPNSPFPQWLSWFGIGVGAFGILWSLYSFYDIHRKAKATA